MLFNYPEIVNNKDIISAYKLRIPAGKKDSLLLQCCVLFLIKKSTFGDCSFFFQFELLVLSYFEHFLSPSPSIL